MKRLVELQVAAKRRCVWTIRGNGGAYSTSPRFMWMPEPRTVRRPVTTPYFFSIRRVNCPVTGSSTEDSIYDPSQDGNAFCRSGTGRRASRIITGFWPVAPGRAQLAFMWLRGSSCPPAVTPGIRSYTQSCPQADGSSDRPPPPFPLGTCPLHIPGFFAKP